jgi:3-ketosteroid 9alpha-monooxygenase subunit A
MYEPGFHTLSLDDLPIAPALVVSSITPIDEGTVKNRLSIALKRRWSGPLDRLLLPVLRAVMARRMMATYREDVPIWENKVFHASPGLCGGDGPIMLLRRWYAGFAAEAEASAPREQIVQLGGSKQRRSSVALEEGA